MVIVQIQQVICIIQDTHIMVFYMGTDIGYLRFLFYFGFLELSLLYVSSAKRHSYV